MSNFITKYVTPSVWFKVKHSFLWSAVYEVKISTNIKKENKHKTWITVELNKSNKFQQITYSNFQFNLQYKVTDYCQSARQVTITTCRKPEVLAVKSDVDDGLLALDAAQLVVK